MIRNNLCIMIVAVILLFSGFSTASAQENEDNLYLIFELMKVDNEQESAYAETETFWKKIHQERVNSGDIIGWDLWSLRPGGEHQGYQYMTVTLFDDPVKMMSGSIFMSHAQKAYPDMSDEELTEQFNNSAKNRDLAVRFYLEQIATTEGDFEMKPGIVASMDLMKVDLGSYDEYESAEMQIFQPYHQERVDANELGNWGLLRCMSPIGSETFASHITVNMYEGWEHMMSPTFNPPDSFSEEMMVNAGLQTRDMKWVYLMQLEEMVR